MTKSPCGTGGGSAWWGGHGQEAPLGMLALQQVLTAAPGG